MQTYSVYALGIVALVIVPALYFVLQAFGAAAGALGG